MNLFFKILLTIILSFQNKQETNFTLSSTTLKGQATKSEIFNDFGCDGNNMSPQLQWSGSPLDTKSFAITMYDKDAPTGSGWWHWLVYDIPANVSNITENAGSINSTILPQDAIQALNDFGFRGYGGPCPPKGDKPHQYVITIHALKIEKLGVSINSNPALVGYYINANTIAKSSLIFYSENL